MRRLRNSSQRTKRPRTSECPSLPTTASQPKKVFLRRHQCNRVGPGSVANCSRKSATRCEVRSIWGLWSARIYGGYIPWFLIQALLTRNKNDFISQSLNTRRGFAFDICAFIWLLLLPCTDFILNYKVTYEFIYIYLRTYHHTVGEHRAGLFINTLRMGIFY